MRNLNLFIAGVEKCGTTSLAEWLIGTGLVEYRVRGVKEPYSFAFGGDQRSSEFDPCRDGVLLDASAGYAFDKAALERMPDRDTQIILCVRSHFDRCYSVYSAYRSIARRGAEAEQLLRTNVVPESVSNRQTFMFDVMTDVWRRHFPDDRQRDVTRYIEEQAGRISNQSFEERVDYEMAFFLRRRSFPFFSVLSNGFYLRPLLNLLDKYRPEQILLVTLDQLESATRRDDFLKRILGQEAAGRSLPPLGQHNTTGNLDVAQEKPDFLRPGWDPLRRYFLEDLRAFEEVADRSGVSMDFVTRGQLLRYLDDPGEAQIHRSA